MEIKEGIDVGREREGQRCGKGEKSEEGMGGRERVMQRGWKGEIEGEGGRKRWRGRDRGM